ncbi:hypothetical protein, partial [Deinococcus sedimenti]|uniref:hypothetical protein n=1 Tax=Deinococcus sedimenti TaxID=1867090 RepID=UPI00166C54EB
QAAEHAISRARRGLKARCPVQSRASYGAGILAIQIGHDDLGLIEILVSTNALLLAQSEEGWSNEVHRRGTRLEWHRVVDHVAIDQGHFVPPSNFGQLMNDTRVGRHLSYGLKADPSLHVVTLAGYTRWVRCLCADLSTIKWHRLQD